MEGKNHLIADALSRNPVFGHEECPDDPTIAHVNQCVTHAPAIAMILDEGLKDRSHMDLADALQNDEEPRAPFKHLWDSLSVIRRKSDNAPLIVVDGKKVLVPQAAQREILQRLHLSHSGENKTLQDARRLFYWQGLTNSIRQMVRNCQHCQALRPSQPREPIRVEPMGVTMPMEALGMDLFHCHSEYLVIVDRFSGFLWVRKLRNTGTDAIIRLLTLIFQEYGNPDRIRSDGGPQFRSSQFEEFCASRFITHEISSPHNPTSNGLAESAVKQAKFLLKKCIDSGENFQEALAAWRNTSRSDGFSPSEAFFGRRLRGALPVLARGAFDPEEFRRVRTESKAQSLDNANKRTVQLSDLMLGDRVYLQDWSTGLWDQKGVITTVWEDGRSYDVKLDNGQSFKRNRRFFRLIKSEEIEESPSEPENHENESESERPLRRSARILAKKSQ